MRLLRTVVADGYPPFGLYTTRMKLSYNRMRLCGLPTSPSRNPASVLTKNLTNQRVRARHLAPGACCPYRLFSSFPHFLGEHRTKRIVAHWGMTCDSLENSPVPANHMNNPLVPRNPTFSPIVFALLFRRDFVLSLPWRHSSSCWNHTRMTKQLAGERRGPGTWCSAWSS